MKGINLKKIGAIVAGSAILASSVAFAGLVYQNTPLVDANGQPVVKIVVGEQAMASDGVVAAYIASKIGNEAYKTSTLTAQVAGVGSCTGETGEGTCTISNEKVKLEVTVPGAGALDREEYRAAIGDYLDRNLENRYYVGSGGTDADEAYTILYDYDDVEANPYQDFIDYYLAYAGTTSTDFNTEYYRAMVRVDNSFGPFQYNTVKPKGSSAEILEGQFFTFAGHNYWDSSDKELKNYLNDVGYSAVFGVTGDYGLPLCPGDPGKKVSGGALSECNAKDQLPSKKVYIKFLGEDWIISEITPEVQTGVAVTDKLTYRLDGSKIKLAKEAVSGILNVGDYLDTGTGYKIRLDDIARESDAQNNHPAIISVLDSNDNEVCQDQIFAGQTEKNLCDSTGVKVHVYQTAPGVMLIAKWAEIGIYSDEIELEDGNEFIDDDDTMWEVAFGWENKGDDVDADPEYLRSIVLYGDASGDYDEMGAGDKFPVLDLPDYHKYDLIYNGVDDSKAEYDTVKWKYDGTVRNNFNIQYDTTTTCSLNISEMYRVTSSNKEAFRRDGSDAFNPVTGIRRGGELWFLYDDTAVADNDCGFTPASGDVIMKDSDNKYWYFPYTATMGAGYSDQIFLYRHAGNEGAMLFYDDGTTGYSWSGHPEMWLVESAGKWKEDVYYSTPFTWDVMTGMGVVVYTDDKLYSLVGGDDKEITHNILTTMDAIDYMTEATSWIALPWEGDATLGYEGGTDYESKFLSMRGSWFHSATSTSRDFKVSKNLLKTSYTFATVESGDADPDTHTLIMGEGDEETIGTTGVKIKVVEITETVSPCTFGTGAGAPACNMDGVSAVIMPNNAPTATVKEVYSLTSNLVVLDRDAVGLDTGTVITVGGDVVNTVTADAIAGSGVDFTAQPVVVRAIGNKIVVAGLTAQDTISAGQQFVAGLTRN